MLRSTAITKELAVIERKLTETTNETLKNALKKKQARLKDELKDASKSAPQLAKTLLAQRDEIKALPKSDFNDLIRRLSKKPEYSFLKTMGKSTIRTDIERPAKPVGWRFKGRGNYETPSKAQIAKGKRSGTVYREVRPLRSDVSRIVRLEDGGGVGKSLHVQFDISQKILNDNSEYFETKESFIIFTKNLSAYAKKYVARNLGEFINDSIENYKYERFLNPDENTSQKSIKDSTGNVKFDLSYSSIEGAFGEELNLSSMNQSELNEFKNYFSEDIGQKVINNIDEFVEYSIENKIRDTKMSNGGVVGQEIVIDYQGDEYKGVISKITDDGDYIVDTDNGRTVLAQREMDVISLGAMKKKPVETERKKRFGLFKDGGKMAFGGLIDENNVSTGGILRMEELSPNETLDEFINNAKYIVSSLEDEGFEKDEIYTFLAHMMIRNTGTKMETGGGVDYPNHYLEVEDLNRKINALTQQIEADYRNDEIDTYTDRNERELEKLKQKREFIMYGKDSYSKGGGVDGMSTVNEIARLSGLRSIAVAEWADKNNVNLTMVLKDLKSKKIKGADLMTAIVGKPGNKYSKEMITQYAK